MKPLLIARGTQPGRCRSCGAAIEWATTPSGAKMPLDPPVVTIPDLHGLDFVEVDRAQTKSHFATCPEAQQWRTRKSR